MRFWPHPAAPKVVRSQIRLHETLARGPTNTLVPSYFRHLHSSAHNHHLFLYFFFSRTNLKHPSRDSNMRLKVNCQADMSACDIFLARELLARDFVGQNNPPLNRLISNTPPCPVQSSQHSIISFVRMRRGYRGFRNLLFLFNFLFYPNKGTLLTLGHTLCLDGPNKV